MADNKKSNKVRFILSVIFAVIAVAALVVTILISPAGSKILGKEETTTTEQAVIETTTEATTVPTTEKEETQATAGEGTTAYSVVVPPPTQPVENPYKNYTLFINTYDFTYTEEKGVTTIIRKDNPDVKMVVTPKGDISYAALCESTKAALGDEKADKKLSIASLNACYSLQSDNTVTTVYCIDDGMGGSIEVRCLYPAADEKADSQFTLMLSMFKIL